MAEPLLRVEGLTVRFGQGAAARTVLDGVSFTLVRGERLGLVGASGSGKSVTLLALLGLLRFAPGGVGGQITAGQIHFSPPNGGAVDLAQATDADWRRVRGRQIAMIFQEPATALNPLMRCGAQVAEGLPPELRRDPQRARQRVLELFAEVRLSEPERVWASYPHQLSGGQRQRVMIAMALAQEPVLLLADEPTTALDPTTQQAVVETLLEVCRARQMALLFVSHDRGVVARLCERTITLAAGQIVPEPRVGGARPSALVAHAPTAELLRVEGLSVALTHRGVERSILRDVSFTLAQGQALALVGESGSGKTTLARALLRLVPVQAGRIQFEGTDWLALSGEALRQRRPQMQLVAQDPFAALNPYRTVRQALAEPLIVHRGLRGAALEARLEMLMAAVRLPASALDRYPHAFSGGQRQRLCIARALALEPSLLICDEAVSALDPDVRTEIVDLLAELQRSTGLSLLFVTHDLAVARQLCTHTLVLHQGRIVEQGSTRELLLAPMQAYTESLVAAAAWADPSVTQA